MLQLLHKYQKSVLLLFTVVIICVSMMSFGVRSYGKNRQASFALKINGEEVTQQQFAIAKSNLENNYRQQFGDFYQQLIQMGGLNLQQQTIDRLIEETLLTQFSSQQDLVVSKKDLHKALVSFLGADLSAEKYQTFLQNTGQTAASFESRLAKQLTPSIFGEIVSDHLNISQVELESAIKKEETTYSYKAFVFDPTKQLAKVAEPSAEELESYYQDHASDYETPEKASYNLVTLTPAENLSLVEITEDDIEIYYTENQEKFATPEKALVRSIILKRDPSNIVADQTASSLADSLIKKINEGEDFEKLAKANSSDAKSADAKWVEKGKSPKEFEAVAFDQGSMGSAKLVTTDASYQILRVEDYQDGKIKPLSEVSPEIKKKLQERDVVAYLQVKAEDLYANWQESGKPLADFATEQKLTLLKTDVAKSANEDLENTTGLSKLVLAQKDLTKQIQEISGNYYLVEISEVVASKIPELAEVKEKLLADFKAEKSVEFARTQADEFLAKVSEANSNLDTIKAGYEVETISRESIKKSGQEEELLSPEIKEDLFSQSAPGILPKTYQHQNNKYYILKVETIVPPTGETIQAKIKEQQEKLRKDLQNKFLSSLIAQLKAQAKIEIAPSLIS